MQVHDYSEAFQSTIKKTQYLSYNVLAAATGNLHGTGHLEFENTESNA